MPNLPDQKLLVAIPTYNESENIERLCLAIWAKLPEIDILVIDDHSPDQTATIVKELQKTYKHLHLIERPGKLGLGTAYVTAFRWALAHSYFAVIEMDADFSHTPEDLVTVANLIRTHPVIIGSRYIEGGGTINWSFLRRLISRFGSFYSRTILSMKTRDLTGGFNGWQRQVLETIDLDSIKSEGYAFQIELKYRAFKAGFNLIETPIMFNERRAGKSKMSGRIVAEAMLKVWQIAWTPR